MVTFVSFICGTFVSFIAEKVWTLWFNLRRAFQTWLAQIKTAISKGKQWGQHQLKTFFVDYSSWRNCFNLQYQYCLMCVWHILPFQSSVYRGKQWTLQLALGLWQCTMGLSIALRIWNIWKCKGLVFAQFWSNIHQSSSNWS